MKLRLVISLYLMCAVLLGLGVGSYSLSRLLNDLEQRGQSDLSLATDHFISELHAHRQLAVSLAQDPRLTDPALDREVLDQFLLRIADLSGALDYVLLDTNQQQIASAARLNHPDWRDAEWISRAFQGTLGKHHTISETFVRRTQNFAVPVFGPDGPVHSVLVVVIDVERIEASFRGDRPAVLLTDEQGVVFYSNRTEMLFRERPEMRKSQTDFYPAGVLTPFPDFSPRRFAGIEIWDIQAGRYLPDRAIHIAREVPVIEMTAEALVDISGAIDQALFEGLITTAALMLFGAVIYFIWRQRRTLALANETLEAAVAERTAELSEVNASLRAEIIEREEAERALKRAQNELIQAEKLSALGKMSAGISHELNQPLMAIQSFAENANAFIDRGKTDVAQANLSRIVDLARRMGRIIKNFRAFARNEAETINKVDLVQVVRDAVDLSENRLLQQGIALDCQLPETPVWVAGGEVRLQQVVLNLMSNAIDAMSASERRQMTIAVTSGAPATLTVADSGPGIADPDKIFEPFYTTKAIGEAEGVGLGLSISYGLIESFGGKLKGANGPDGGAVFTIELPAWTERNAA